MNTKKPIPAIAMLAFLIISMSVVSVHAVSYTWYVKAGDKFTWDVKYSNSTGVVTGTVDVTVEQISDTGVLTAKIKATTSAGNNETVLNSTSGSLVGVYILSKEALNATAVANNKTSWKEGENLKIEQNVDILTMKMTLIAEWDGKGVAVYYFMNLTIGTSFDIMELKLKSSMIPGYPVGLLVMMSLAAIGILIKKKRVE